MKRETVTLGGSSNLPLSPGVKVGNFLYTSGQVGVDRSTGTVPEDAGEQTRFCFENLRKILVAGGVDFEDVFKVNVYLTDNDDFAAMNEVYRTYFPNDPPARTTVGTSGLARPDFKVEIEMIALLKD